MNFSSLISNAGGDKAKIRYEELDGRRHLVVPTVMLTEGVHKGSDGLGLYEEKDMKKSDPAWNHKPIVLYHPTRHGKGISAADPIILSTRRVGILLNTKTVDGKQHTESWLDEEKTKRVDKRVLEMLADGKPVEVSTGLYNHKEQVSGTWGSEKYDFIVRDYQPDHLAILPDQIGACSIADGAGLLRNSMSGEVEAFQVVMDRSLCFLGQQQGLVTNEMSFDKVTRFLVDLLSSTYGEPGRYWEGHIEAVYPDMVIYHTGGVCYMQKYEKTDNDIKLTGKPQPVERFSGYRTPDGSSVVTNSSGVLTNTEKVEMAFNKKAHIDSLIGFGFEETDRPELEKMSEATLAKLQPVKATPTNNTTQPNNTILTPAPSLPAPVTVEQYLANAPDGIRQVLTNSVAAMNQRKNTVVAAIMATPRCRFTKEHLERKELQELEHLLELAGGSATPTTNSSEGVPMFVGSYLPHTSPLQNQRAMPEVPPPGEGLKRPVLEFGKK